MAHKLNPSTSGKSFGNLNIQDAKQGDGISISAFSQNPFKPSVVP